MSQHTLQHIQRILTLLSFNIFIFRFPFPFAYFPFSYSISFFFHLHSHRRRLLLSSPFLRLVIIASIPLPLPLFSSPATGNQCSRPEQVGTLSNWYLIAITLCLKTRAAAKHFLDFGRTQEFRRAILESLKIKLIRRLVGAFGCGVG